MSGLAPKGPVGINELAGRLGLASRGRHWNTGVSMLRSNDLIVATPQGFALGRGLSDFMALNGLDAVRVSRPSPWSNPFPWRGDWIMWAAVAAGFRGDRAGRIPAAVAFHRAWVTSEKANGPLANSKNNSILEYESGIALDTAEVARSIAVQMAWIERNRIRVPAAPSIDAIQAALRGKNLACWCKLDEMCHADTLLELANLPPARMR